MIQISWEAASRARCQIPVILNLDGIPMSTLNTKGGKYEVVHESGRVVSQGKFKFNNEYGEFNLPVGGLPLGKYEIHIETVHKEEVIWHIRELVTIV